MSTAPETARSSISTAVPTPNEPSITSHVDGEKHPQDQVSLPSRKAPVSTPTRLSSHEPHHTDIHFDTATIASSTNMTSLSPLHEVAFVAVISASQLLTQAGLGQCIAPLHIIGESLGTSSPAQLSWYAAAYSLTVGTFILPSGRLGDVYGHRNIFLIGWFWYSLWSLLAGFSVYVQRGTGQGSIYFDIMRAMQGIGPALLLPNGLAILGRTYEPGPRKDMVFSLFGATAPSGFVIGAVFSSLLSQKAWWPWAYWIMAIVNAALLVLSYFIIPKAGHREFRRTMSRGGLGWRARWLQLDMNGMITGVIGLVLINFAWNQGPVVGWTTPYTYALLIVGVLFIVFFLYIERIAPNPLIPRDALNTTTLFVIGCMAAGWSSFGIWVFYFWQIIEVIRDGTPLLGTAYMTPVCISGLCAALATGFLLSKIGPAWIMLCSMCMFCVGTILIATAPVNQIYWAQLFVSTILMPWGMDMSFPSATIILSNAVSREHQGSAASLVNTVVNYSVSIGLGFAGTVETRLNHGGLDVLRGYRSALYLGIGLSGLGVGIATVFASTHRHIQLEKESEEDQSSSEGKA